MTRFRENWTFLFWGLWDFVWGLPLPTIFWKKFFRYFVVLSNCTLCANFFENRLNRLGDIH